MSQNTTTYPNPSWWTKDHDSSWDRVKAAFERDWDQTKHDMGGKQPNTNQQVKDTVKQASGKEAIPPRGTPVYDEVEPAYRFGYGARAQYGKKYSTWNNDLEKQLKNDWGQTYKDRTWEDDAEYVRSGWDYKE